MALVMRITRGIPRGGCPPLPIFTLSTMCFSEILYRAYGGLLCGTSPTH
jgi:hypothetical protein